MSYPDFYDSIAKHEFLEKCDVLSQYYEEYSPTDFYRFIFPADDIESPSKVEGRPNPIYAYEVLKKDDQGNQLYKTVKGRDGLSFQVKQSYMVNKIMTNKYDFDNDFKRSDFAICGLYTSWGKKRGSTSAFTLYGFAFDIDGVGTKQLNTLLYGIDTDYFPRPTFIVNSGHGVHLYYIFEQGVPLYPRFKPTLERLKKGLTYLLWNKDTTDAHAGSRQFQSIFQSMRMVGSKTKFGKGTKRTKYRLRAWKTGDRVDLTYLNHYVDSEWQMFKNPRDYASELVETVSLEEARKRWPDWYERRIVRKEAQGRYYCNRQLYDWWLNKLKYDTGLRDGHRYYAIGCLFVYAVKCNIPYEEAEKDALSLVPFLDMKTVNPGNPFTADDVLDASVMYDQKWVRMSRKFIEEKTGIRIDPSSKRNGRKQDEHLKRARLLRTLSSYDDVGRPTKEMQVKEYFDANPNESISQAARDLKMSRNTVAKWKHSQGNL